MNSGPDMITDEESGALSYPIINWQIPGIFMVWKVNKYSIKVIGM